jgi:hypothetical protein
MLAEIRARTGFVFLGYQRSIFVRVAELASLRAHPRVDVIDHRLDRRKSMSLPAFMAAAGFSRHSCAGVDDAGLGLAGWAGHNWHSELFGSGEKKTPQKLPPKNKNNPSVSLVFFGEFFGEFFGLRKIELFVNFSEFFGVLILLVF